MVTMKDLELELKKRGWEQYLDFTVAELRKGVSYKAVFKAIAEKDAEDFENSLEKPEKLYLPKSYMQGEFEVILGGKEKIEGFLEVNGKTNLTPKCHAGQSPYRSGRILGCKDNQGKFLNE